MSYNPVLPAGQAASAASAPVVIASDQSPVQAKVTDGTNTAGVFASGTANSTASALVTAGTSEPHTWSVTSVSVGTTYDVGNHAWVSVQVTAFYVGTTPTVTFQCSDDGTNWFSCSLLGSSQLIANASPSVTAVGLYHGPLPGRYFRVNFTGAYSSGTSTGVISFSTTPRGLATGGVVAAQNGAWNVGVAASATGGYTGQAITTATTTTVKSGAGTLRSIAVDTPVAAETITIYDALTATGTPKHTITIPATVGNPFVLTYEEAFSTGLTIVTSSTAAISVAYK